MNNRFINSGRHVNEFLRTETGRLAGSGIVHDDYTENSCGGYWNEYRGHARFPERTDEQKRALFNSPVVTYKIREE